MGRPLNKKYFGNLNETGLGGESVASITVTDGGSYTSIPGVSIDPPALPGGVTATAGLVTMGALSAVVNTIGTGDTSKDYAPGDRLTLVGGTGTAPSFTVQTVKIRTAGIVTDPGDFSDGDTVTFSTGWDTPAVLTLSVSLGVVTNVSYTNPGVWTSPILPADPVTPDSTSGGGTVASSSFNIGFGVGSVSLFAPGALTALPASPSATTTDSQNGQGATLTVTYEVTEVAVNEPGSGYVDASDAGVSFGAGTATADAVLTVTTPAAITPYAVTIIGGTALPADIIKQVGESTYLMQTTEGSKICTLGTTDTPLPGGAYLVATDSNGSTYYITKLTAHLAQLYRRTMVGSYVYENEDSAPWKLDAPDNLVVQVFNT